MTKQFPKADLLALGLPGECCDEAGNEGVIVRTKIIENTRWSIVKEVTFKLPGQDDGSAWVAGYRVGATESQDESPWEHDDTVECTLVRKVERVVTVWTEVDA